MRFSVLVFVFQALVPVSLAAQPDAWLRSSTEPIDLPGGSRVVFTSMDSEAIRGPAPYSIFLPPSYKREGNAYPVVYFLHGLFNDHTSWTIDRHGDIPALVDGLMSRKELQELVLVFPDGGKSFYTNYRDGSLKYEDFIAKELPRHVEETYRVKSGRGDRAIAGTSMGGYGALKIAMKYPDRYAAVAAHSPIVFPIKNPLDVPPEARSGRYYQYLSSIFLTVYGNPFDQTYFDANNPIELAAKSDLNGLGILFDYGTADRYNRSIGLGSGLRKLDRALTASGVEHTFREYAGEPHGWELVYTHIGESLEFLARHLAD